MDDLSVGRKMPNYSNGHSSDTGRVKKKKKIRYSRSHIVTHLCPFMGQNSKIWGVKKIGQRFGKTEPSDSKRRQTPRVCRTPPKIFPPYSLGTCPPTTPPEHFDALSLLHREKIDFLKTPDFDQSTQTSLQ